MVLEINLPYLCLIFRFLIFNFFIFPFNDSSCLSYRPIRVQSHIVLLIYLLILKKFPLLIHLLMLKSISLLIYLLDLEWFFLLFNLSILELIYLLFLRLLRVLLLHHLLFYFFILGYFQNFFFKSMNYRIYDFFRIKVKIRVIDKQFGIHIHRIKNKDSRELHVRM